MVNPASTSGHVSTRAKSRTPALAISLTVIGIQITILGAVAIQSRIPPERLFNDTIVVAEELPGCCHVYDGLVSGIGIMMWWSTAAIAGFVTMVLMEVDRGARRTALSFAVAAAFTGLLAIDDQFMLHDGVFPSLGLKQSIVIFCYGILATIYVTACWRTIISGARTFAAFAFTLLAASAITDFLADHDLSRWLNEHPEIELFMEDGFKFLGIGCWLCLHLLSATAVIGDQIRMRSL